VPKRFPKITGTRILLVTTALIVGYFLVIGATTALRSSRLGDREDRLSAEVAGLQQRYERLQALREYLSSEDYIETVAREQLGLVRQGETSIIVISTAPSPTPTPSKPEEDDLWWEEIIH
jgi:cell division protein DivIC